MKDNDASKVVDIFKKQAQTCIDTSRSTTR